MLPSFGPGGIWFSKLTETGMFITHSNAGGRRIIDGDGLNMGPTVCNGRVYFTSTRDGNSEIYSASTGGGKAYQSAVIPSRLVTARSATTWS